MVFASRDSGCESHRFVGSGHSNLFFDPFADHPRYPWPDEQVAYADSCQSPLGIAVLHTCKVQLKGVAEVCLPLERQSLLALFCFCYLGLGWRSGLLAEDRHQVGLLDQESGKELLGDTVLELCEEGRGRTRGKGSVPKPCCIQESKTFELKLKETPKSKPVPSLLRGFSAPVKLEYLATDRDPSDLLHSIGM